jgi:hypothetical protein
MEAQIAESTMRGKTPETLTPTELSTTFEN